MIPSLQYGLQLQRFQMIDVFRVGKATPVDPRSHFSEIIDSPRVGRRRTGVFNAESAFGAGLVGTLGRDQGAMARNDLLLALSIHGSCGEAVTAVRN